MADIKPFSISHIFDAPRAIVFQAHTDPIHLTKWYSPAGSHIIKAEMDLRQGGVYHYGLRMPDNHEMWGKQQFRQVVVPEKLVFIQSFSDKDGGLTRHPMAPTWPQQVLATTTFEDLDNKTRVTVSWLPYEAEEEAIKTFEAARDGMRSGFNGTFDALDTYLAQSSQQILLSLLLDAPPDRVWNALTDPTQVNTWWGPNGFKNFDVEQDVRVGGLWRFKMLGPDGTVYPNRCIYHELKEPERLVYDHGDEESIHFQATITLENEAGKTRICLGLRFPTREARDGVVKFGALEGGVQTLTKLANFLK